jgi:hypothetical protein
MVQRRSRVVLAMALLASVAGGSTAAVARAQIKQPTGPVTGTMRLSWQEERRYDPTIMRTEGEVVYTVSGRMPTASAAEAWTPGEIPPWAEQTRRNPGYLLRARMAAPRYRQTVEQTCESGVATTTTVITDVTQPQALLLVEEPEFDLVRGIASLDLELAWAVNRDGIYRYGQAIFSSGGVATHTTGTDCSGATEEGVRVPAPVDTIARSAIADLMGAEISESVIDGFKQFTGTVDARGTARLRTTQALPDVDPRPETTRSGTLRVDLTLGPPPGSQNAFCVLPSDARLARVRTLAAARALLKRHGLPTVPFGGERPDATRKGRYFLRWSSPSAWCGRSLGTRRNPVLYRSRGIVQ